MAGKSPKTAGASEEQGTQEQETPAPRQPEQAGEPTADQNPEPNTAGEPVQERPADGEYPQTSPEEQTDAPHGKPDWSVTHGQDPRNQNTGDF